MPELSKIVSLYASERSVRGSFIRLLQNFWRDTLLSSDPARRRRLLLATFLLVLVLGLLDYLTGFEVSLLVFYCIPVLLGTAAFGWRLGVTVSIASVASEAIGDIAAGAHYQSWVVPFWKPFIALSTYLVIVWLFATVRTLQAEMQERVRQRTEALSAEIAERERLERILLDISQRERSSMGRELHDNLGQHLTGTAFAGQVLGEKLQILGLAEQADAWRLVALIEEGIEKTRHLAKGLLVEQIQPEGLVDALRELATDLSVQFRVVCEFRAEGDCRIADAGVPIHLLRIAQEAARNGVRHGKAKRVVIALTGRNGRLELSVRDHGGGLPPAGRRGDGLGLRIMAHRAQIIGADFAVEAAPDGGTVVTCRLPAASHSHDH
jgi:signal transduction histidine kinase